MNSRSDCWDLGFQRDYRDREDDPFAESQPEFRVHLYTGSMQQVSPNAEFPVLISISHRMWDVRCEINRKSN